MLLLLLSFNLHAQALKMLTDIPGKHEISMRTRFQDVNDTWLGDAQAFTSRIKLTSSFSLNSLLPSNDGQWQILLEPNLVLAFNDKDYNSITIKKSTSPIPDPESFDWRKANINYTSDDNWQMTIGRQPLSFNNERMIGAIEFWQTPQSFDAIKFEFNNQIDWRIQYAYSNKVQRIFGHNSTSNIPKEDIRFGSITQRPINELGQHALTAHLLNIHYKTEDNLSFSVYNYFVDNKDQSKFSNNTLGLRLEDEFKPHQLKYRYTVEYAQQTNINENPDHYQAWYNLLEASVQYRSHTLQLSQEILSEDNGYGFKTPLGTNHKFQGWADIFTGYTMQAGLRDQYITYKGRKNKLRWRVVFHRFKSFSEQHIIGDELDLEFAYRATRKWELKLVYAHYKAEDGLMYFPKASHDLSTWFASIAYNI